VENNSSNSRVIAWFSCGAASAVATAEAIKKYGKGRVHVVYCNTLATEHEDNQRFLKDVENWLGVTVEVISSTKYDTVDDVFEYRKYLAGISGAPCTTEMKKVPRFNFQEPDDIHVFGLTWEEQKRVDRFEHNNPDLYLDWLLVDGAITKAECHKRIADAGIDQPVMYQLGFKNNNCLGCVKASSLAYWRKTRYYFPEVFAKRAEQSRRFGAKLTRIKGKRIFLDEIPPDPEGTFDPYEQIVENISCGPECRGERNEDE
jgi:hypothetical protein